MERSPHDAQREERLNEILAQYLIAVQEERVLDRHALLTQHPDLTEELIAFFADQDRLDRATVPLHELLEAMPPGASQIEKTRIPNASTVLPVTVPSADRPDIATLQEIARGGMGVVYRGRDNTLHRDLAVKVLREEYRSRPEMVRRFVEEAQICGQLTHPGVVAVYELGLLADGRPYFTMKLIEGQTLAALLAARRDPREDLPRFLAVFEQVAQTISYAHARGVVHRDLKPANIMVSAFGEVQVMDWGMAKVSKRCRTDCAESTQNAQVRTVRSELAGDSSQMGAVLGTLAYMSPEQACGQVDLLDERVDVFGLGAILCVILTGEPPYRETTRAEVHQQAAGGDLADAFARLDAYGADQELIGLAKACLAPDRAHRLRHPGEVARAVTTYRAAVQERLRSAELEGAAARARARAERRARLWTVGAALASLLLLAVGGATAWHLRQQEVERHHDVEAALKQVSERREKGDWGGAWAALQRAEGRLAGADQGTLAERVRTARKELETLAILDTARLQDAVDGVRSPPSHHGEDEPYRKAFNRRVDELYQKAFAGYGLEVGRMEPQKAARRIRELPLREPFVDALDHWAYVVTEERRRDWLREVASLADSDPWRHELRAALRRCDWGKVIQCAQQPGVDEKSTPSLMLLTHALNQARRPQLLLELLRGAQRRRPSDFWLTFTLGSACDDAGQREEAIWYYTAARALRPDSTLALCTLGNALVVRGKFTEAEAAYREAIHIKPDDPYAHFFLGYVLQAEGQPDRAVAARKEALRLKPEDPSMYYGLGWIFHAQGKSAEAINAYRTAIRFDGKYAEAYCGLSIALYDLGKWPEALEASKKAIALNPELPEAHLGLGVVLQCQGKLAQAVAALRDAIRLNPNDPHAHHALGDALHDLGKWAEAEKAYREALRLKPTDTEAHYKLGNTLADLGEAPEAIAALKEAIRLRPHFPEALFSLGNVLLTQSKLSEAVTAYPETTTGESFPSSLNLPRGICCFDIVNRGRLSEAEAAYRGALRLRPDFPEAWHRLGYLLHAQDRLPEAVTAYREAIRLNPEEAEIHYLLGQALLNQGEWQDATVAFKEASRLRPDWSDPRLALGAALRGLGQYIEARDAYRREYELRRYQASRTSPSRAALDLAERLAILEANLSGFLQSRRRPAGIAESLDLASICFYTGMPVEAYRFYREAFAADPGTAADVRNGCRYHAACAAALVAINQGEEARTLFDRERALLRGHALQWLRADLEAWGRLIERGSIESRQKARERLHYAQRDRNLAGVRHPWSLLRLPASERHQWQKLWADVAALLKKAAKTRT
jgi:serine/threonine-protein kinase